MAITGLKALEIWRDCFASGNCDSVAEIITDDFVFVRDDDEGYTDASTSRDETLSWISNTKVRISDFDVLYENDEVVMGFHMVSVPESPLSKVMFFARKEHGKFSYWRVHRLLISE